MFLNKEMIKTQIESSTLHKKCKKLTLQRINRINDERLLTISKQRQQKLTKSYLQKCKNEKSKINLNKL